MARAESMSPKANSRRPFRATGVRLSQSHRASVVERGDSRGVRDQPLFWSGEAFPLESLAPSMRRR